MPSFSTRARTSARSSPRRKTESLPGNGHLEGFVSNAESEVVHFVDDQQVELATQARHVAERVFECRDGQSFDTPLAVPQTANRTSVNACELRQPLLSESCCLLVRPELDRSPRPWERTSRRHNLVANRQA